MASTVRRIALAALCIAATACGPVGSKAPAATASSAGEGGPPASVTVDLGRRVTMKLVLVRAGTFEMGSAEGPDEERPVHEVTIAQPFYLAATEVTQEQWEAVMGAPPAGARAKGDELPVENVTWDECRRFLAKLNAKAGGAAFVMPSEAQWEYACRAGSKSWWCDGDNETGLGRYAVYGGNSGIDRPVRTHPVGLLKANAFGLHDMHGNVSEFCADSWHPGYRGAPADGSAWEPRDDAPHVIRGGSFTDSWRVVHSAWRDRLDPDLRLATVGLRVARPVAVR